MRSSEGISRKTPSLPSFCDCIYFETELLEGEVVGQTRLSLKWRSLKACDNMVAYVTNSAAAAGKGGELEPVKLQIDASFGPSVARAPSTRSVGSLVPSFIPVGRNFMDPLMCAAAAARSALRCLFVQSAHSPPSFAPFAGGEGEGEREQVGPSLRGRAGTVPLLLSLWKMDADFMPHGSHIC